MTEPYHRDQKFDYIVSNPPFKLDFSDDIDTLARKENKERFFAGLPNIPKKAKDKMAIYPLFIQHIMSVLAVEGKAAVVVPTGFITAQSGIEKRIRQRLVEEKMLAGVVSMPSNIFATTGTNVSILFLDKTNTAADAKVMLINASGLGSTVKDGKNQKTALEPSEEQQIINAFVNKEVLDDFSLAVSYDEIKEKNYSLSAGQYFEIKIEYFDITQKEFKDKLQSHESQLNNLFSQGVTLQNGIMENLKLLGFEEFN